MNLLNVLLRNTAPLLSLFIFVLGNGFSSTYMATVLAHNHTSSILIGLMSTSLYAGLVLGSFKMEKLIARIAHIRSYAAFASIITVISLLSGLFVNVYLWLILRFMTGIAVAGVFIVIESWLLSHAEEKTRGQVLSFYMVTFYAAQSLGQLFLKYESTNVLFFFSFIAISSSLSILPLAMTKADMPNFSEPSTLGIKKLYRLCASGLYACLIGGLVLGCIYGLFPLFLIKIFNNQDSVALYMFAIIFGGMFFQYPIGKLSDLIERRIVLILIAASSIILAVCMFFFINHDTIFFLLCTLFGGFTFTLYPVSISHACDSLGNKDIVAGIQTLLLVYSIGAMLGPVLASFFMKMTDWGLFIYFIILLLSLVIFLSWRKTVKENQEQEESFITYPQVTPVSSKIDPRNEQSI
jgi:MFS family permease